MENNVVDLKTRNVIFSQPLKNKLQTGLKHYVEDADPEVLNKMIDTVEQIICTSLITAARNVASKLAAKAFSRFNS